MARRWTDAEKDIVRNAYMSAKSQKSLNLSDLAKSLGRGKSEVSRIARKLVLTDKNRKSTDDGPKDPRKFKTKEELSKFLSDEAKKRIQKNGHPKGMKGKSHTKETRDKLSTIGRERWANMPQDERDSLIANSTMASIKSRSSPPKIKRGSWAAGWRCVGDRRIYFRSRWEANYARYLEWLKSRGEILKWEYEPETFWFEAIKRGVRSYKPDFRVWELDGTSMLHEVKGWMDDRSKTILRRMAKYHPNETIILIDTKAYKAIRRNASGLVYGWEDSERDARI